MPAMNRRARRRKIRGEGRAIPPLEGCERAGFSFETPIPARFYRYVETAREQADAGAFPFAVIKPQGAGMEKALLVGYFEDAGRWLERLTQEEKEG